jgi:lipopolysaccharide export system permease protein
MKSFIFYRYVLKEHIGPFIFSLSLIVFLLLINFTLREAGLLFGRGLSVWIIAKAFYYHMAPVLSLAIPIGVILSTLMAFLRLSADSEITILRSSGINLTRVLLPLLLVSIIISYLLFIFMNTVLPQYNVESSKVWKEISRLKPTAKIFPHTFTELKHVRIYVETIDNDFNERLSEKREILGEDYENIPVDHLFNVIIYDFKDSNKSITILAKEAFVLLNEEKKVFEFILLNGESQEVEYKDADTYKATKFDKSIFYITAAEFVEEDTEKEVRYKSSRQKNTSELLKDIKREENTIIKRHKSHLKNFNRSEIQFISFDEKKILERKIEKFDSLFVEKHEDSLLLAEFKNKIIQPYKNFLTQEGNRIRSTQRQIKFARENIYNYEGEWHKKYAIPFAVIIFVLIGAPLGMMTQKDESGTAIAISLIVFLVNHSALIIGEKWSEAGRVSPFVGLWFGNIFNGILGLYLVYLLSKEKTIEFAFINKLFKKFRK